MATPDAGQMLTQLVPFVRTLQLSIAPVTTVGQATVTLPCTPAVQNHMGTAHAGAAYTAAESASGAAALSLFADVVASGAYVALKSSTVTHKKARAGDVVARAVIEGNPRDLRAAYQDTGKADFNAVVELSVDGVPTAEMVFVWAVRRPRS